MKHKQKLNKKAKLLVQQGNNCMYCKTKFKSLEEITLDHIVPQSKGGTDALVNLGLSCHKCNREKGNFLLTEYLRAKEIKVTPIIARYL